MARLPNVDNYTNLYGTGNFNSRLVIGLKDDSTLIEVKRRAEFITYFKRLQAFYYNYRKSIPSYGNPNENTDGEPGLFAKANNGDAIENAIRLLKQNGYKVMQQKVEYVEI